MTLQGQPVADDALDLVERLRQQFLLHPKDQAGHTKLRELVTELDNPTEGTESVLVHTWAEIGEAPVPRDWVLTNWLPSGAVTLLSGPGASGKSTFSIQLAAAVAAGVGADVEWGGPYIDHRLAGGAPVVFASWEDQPTDIARKLSELSAKSPWVKPDIPLLIAGDKLMGMTGRGPLWEPPQRMAKGILTPLASRLMEVAEREGVVLLILDSAAACYADNENDRAAVRAFLVHFHEWAIRNKAAVLLLAHPPKSGAAFSGSTDWHAGCRALWTLGKEPWGRVKQGADEELPYFWKLTCEKSNYAIGGPPEALRLDWTEHALQSLGSWDSKEYEQAHAGKARSNGAGKGYDRNR